LDAVCEAIACNQVTKEERKLIHAAARSQYANALRRFSNLVVYGRVPPDLLILKGERRDPRIGKFNYKSKRPRMLAARIAST
jgi:hypothetical protein